MEFLKNIKYSFSRRKFFSAAVLSATAFGIIYRLGGRRIKKQKTARFLSQDGKLVEVPIKHVQIKKTKATNAEVKNWIWEEGNKKQVNSAR